MSEQLDKLNELKKRVRKTDELLFKKIVSFLSRFSNFDQDRKTRLRAALDECMQYRDDFVDKTPPADWVLFRDKFANEPTLLDNECRLLFVEFATLVKDLERSVTLEDIRSFQSFNPTVN